jgi:hypothetical protein
MKIETILKSNELLAVALFVEKSGINMQFRGVNVTYERGWLE